MAIDITRPAGVNQTQFALLPVLLLVLLVASTWAALSGSAVVVVAIFIVLIGGYLVVKYPALGILIYLTTFLLTYPAALRGFGNLTINNILGMVLLPLLLFGTWRDGISWFWRSKPLLWIALAGLILLTAGRFYNQEVTVEGGRASVSLRRGVDPELHGRRAGVAGSIVRTRDPAIKLMTRYAFLLFFVFFVRTPRQLKMVLAVLIGILLLTYLNVSTEAGELGWGRGRLRVQAGVAGTALYTGTNPNKLAFYALLCLTFLWYGRNRITSYFLWPVWLVVAGSALALIPLTASRSGFLNLILFLIIILFEGRFGLRKLAGLALVASLAVMQFGYDLNVLDMLLPERAAERITKMFPDQILSEGQTTRGSFQIRARHALGSTRVIGVNPLLGAGLDSYPTTLEALDPNAMIGPPHNSYIWAAAEGGFVTLGLYLASFVWILMWLRNILRDYKGRFGPVDLEWLVRGTRTALILFMVFSVFADMWINILFHILIGLCLATILLHRTYAETGQVPGTDIGAPLVEQGTTG